MNPKAMTTKTKAKTENGWYSIKAKANEVAEISIYEEIGGWGGKLFSIY